MAENKVSVEITLEEKAALSALAKLSGQIQKTENSFTGLGKEGDKTMGILGEASKGVSLGFKSLVGGVTVANLASDAIIGTANAIRNFVNGSVNAAIEQENAINRLNQSLRASGDFSAEASQDFISFASSLQKLSVFGDEVVIGQLAVAKSFGATNEQAKQLVQAAANLSATFGGSLESNVEKLGKTFSGSAGRLAQFIPALKNLSEEQLKSGKAFDVINSKFGGAAANELNTYQGQVTSLSNAYSDLQEQLGMFVTNNAAVLSVTARLRGFFESATQSLADFMTVMDRGRNGFIENEESMNQLSRQYESIGIKIEELEKKSRLLPGGLDNFDSARLKAYRKELEGLERQVQNASVEVKVTQQKEQIAKNENGESVPSINKDPSSQEKEKYAKMIALRKDYYAQLQLSEAEYAAYTNEQRLLATEITEQNREIELQRLIEFETEKINASFLAEEQKAAMIADAQTREYAQAKIASDRKLALEKKTADSVRQIDAQMAQAKAESFARITAITGSAFQLAAALAKDGSKEQFLIQKGAALAEIALARGKAIALIPAQTAHIPFPANIPAAATLTAYANAQAALGAATVAAQAIKGFQNGGIIGGNSITGDLIPIMANSSEMILNRQQQGELFRLANGGVSGGGNDVKESIDRLTSAIISQPINLMVDGRTLATVIRKEVQAGFKIA